MRATFLPSQLIAVMPDQYVGGKTVIARGWSLTLVPVSTMNQRAFKIM